MKNEKNVEFQLNSIGNWKIMGKNKIPIKKYENLMKNEKNVDFPLNNMGNLQKDEEMAGGGDG